MGNKHWGLFGSTRDESHHCNLDFQQELCLGEVLVQITQTILSVAAVINHAPYIIITTK